jgi:hypothetical protein
MSLPVRTCFFFATSGLVELPTFASLFPGLQGPADFVEPRGFSESVFLGFERPTALTARCVFSSVLGDRRGGRLALLGTDSTASWTWTSASTYARRSQCNIHGDCLLVYARYITHDTFCRNCNKYASISNT